MKDHSKARAAAAKAAGGRMLRLLSVNGPWFINVQQLAATGEAEDRRSGVEDTCVGERRVVGGYGTQLRPEAVR